MCFNTVHFFHHFEYRLHLRCVRFALLTKYQVCIYLPDKKVNKPESHWIGAGKKAKWMNKRKLIAHSQRVRIFSEFWNFNRMDRMASNQCCGLCANCEKVILKYVPIFYCGEKYSRTILDCRVICFFLFPIFVWQPRNLKCARCPESMSADYDEKFNTKSNCFAPPLSAEIPMYQIENNGKRFHSTAHWFGLFWF